MSVLDRRQDIFSVEQPTTSSVDRGIEQAQEIFDDAIPENPEEGIRTHESLPPAQVPSQTSSASGNDTRTTVFKKIEGILADGLMDIYISLSAEQQRLFKARGEAVAKMVTDMVMRGKMSLKKIWRLIKSWLGSLPGVNTYFLEQEAKIKTDHVMRYAKTVQSAL